MSIHAHGRATVSGQRSFVDHDVAFESLAQDARAGRLVVFVGAGVSKDAGLPIWRELVEPLRVSLKLVPGTDPRRVVDRYCTIHGRVALTKYLQVELGRVREPGRLHRAIARIPSQMIVTTNYDRLLEMALLHARGEVPNVVTSGAGLDLVFMSRATTVIKLHGCLATPRSIVITSRDYADYPSRHAPSLALLRVLASVRTFLYIGCSLSDAHVRSIHIPVSGLAHGSPPSVYQLDADGAPSDLSPSEDGPAMKRVAFRDFHHVRDFVERLADAAVALRKDGTRRLLPAD